MAETIGIERLLSAIGRMTIVDVRTPAEYEQAHVPGAYNLPLFSNDERARVGTVYSTQGRHEAMLLALDIVGPRMRDIVEAACAIPGKEWVMYCWRGGMRSEATAWLLSFFGWKIVTLEGGYRTFRRRMVSCADLPVDLRVLGGKTGSGKTQVLEALRRRGEQVIDLEALAHHKGSAFGALGEAPPPSQERFENDVGYTLFGFDRQRPVWIEDESRNIGRRIIPEGLWARMRRAPVYFLDVPIESRCRFLVEHYGGFSPPDLSASIERIERRLGGLHTREALDALSRGDLYETARILLEYYDRAYLHGLSQRDATSIVTVPCESTDPEQNALCVLRAATSEQKVTPCNRSD